MKNFRWYEWAMLAVLLALLGIGLAVSPFGAWIWGVLNSANAPAWVQAIGSILAIWGTYRVAERQFQREQARLLADVERLERAAREDGERQRELIVGIAIDSVEAVFEFQNRVRRQAPSSVYKFGSERLQDAIHALRSLLLRPLPAGSATPILDLQRSVSRCLRDTSRMEGKPFQLQEPEQHVIQERAYNALAQARLLSGFNEAWQARQNDAAFPATVMQVPGTL